MKKKWLLLFALLALSACGPTPKSTLAALKEVNLDDLPQLQVALSPNAEIAAIKAPNRYSPSKLKAMAASKLGVKYIVALGIWAERGSADFVNLAEYQALTGSKRYETKMLELAETYVRGFPATQDFNTAYQLYATNPEPKAIWLARGAALNPKLREVLCPVLQSLLQKIHDGTHGYVSYGEVVNFGKISLCRVRIMEGLKLACDPMADYGVNRGGRWMLERTTNGYLHWLTGSPWYQIFNNPLVEMLWSVRNKLTKSERAAFDAVYFFPFNFQVDGKSPLIGEDSDLLRLKPYLHWSGYYRIWLGSDARSEYMRWVALYEVQVDRHFDDLLCPDTPETKPTMPELPVYYACLPWFSIERHGNDTWLHYNGWAPSIDGSHKGTNTVINARYTKAPPTSQPSND